MAVGPAARRSALLENGWVSLKGYVTYQFQSDAAYDDVASMQGAHSITNEIVVSTP
jgi:osmotically-inducible protein OsmY